jgi:SAM-dependent methyltransferase
VPLDEYERAMFLPGKRYALAGENLNRDRRDNLNLVELGCGSGQALSILSRDYRFRSILGIDIAATPKMVGEGFHIVKADLDATWPIPSGDVDILLAMMLLEHLYDPFHSFSEIKRVLSPSGAAFINLPLVTSLQNRLRLALGRLPITSMPYDSWFQTREWDGNHLHYFSLSAIQKLALATGLKVSEFRGVGRFHRLKTLFPQFLAGEITFKVAHA